MSALAATLAIRGSESKQRSFNLCLKELVRVAEPTCTLHLALAMILRMVYSSGGWMLFSKRGTWSRNKCGRCVDSSSITCNVRGSVAASLPGMVRKSMSSLPSERGATDKESFCTRALKKVTCSLIESAELLLDLLLT